MPQTASSIRLAPRRWPLLLGLGVSVVAHLGAAAVLAVNGSMMPVIGAPPPAPALEPDRQRLGIERSDASTITWLGFEEPTPQQAQQADVEQAQFAIAAAERLATEVQRAASEAPRAISALTEAMAREAARQSAASGVEIPDASAPAPDLIVGAPEPKPQTPGETSEREAAEASPQAAEQAGEGDASEDGAPIVDPENDGQNDRDSPARSLEAPVKVEPGKPVAAEGLEIQTVRAKWTHTTLLTSRPKNPVIRVFFDREGRVAKAVFERSSGAKYVDEPLLNAVYQWRAKGDALADLTPEGEGSMIEVVFEIGLR
ncbi:MAG: hypothetical protein ACF8QF_04115 [Phycisphaerales bacterium]